MRVRVFSRLDKGAGVSIIPAFGKNGVYFSVLCPESGSSPWHINVSMYTCYISPPLPGPPTALYRSVYTCYIPPPGPPTALYRSVYTCYIPPSRATHSPISVCDSNIILRVVKGVLFTVHEENKSPITVHEDNKHIYSTHGVNSWNMWMAEHIIAIHIQNLTFPTLKNYLLSDSIKSFFWQFISTLLGKLYAKIEQNLIKPNLSVDMWFMTSSQRSSMAKEKQEASRPDSSAFNN